MVSKKLKAKPVVKEKEKPFSLFSVNSTVLNLSSSWISLLPLSTKFEVVFNLLLISEFVLAQLVASNGLTIEQAMKREIHRTIVKTFDDSHIKKFLIALAVEATVPYSKAIKNQDMVNRFQEIDNAKPNQTGQFKGVKPTAKMSDQALLKYSVGYVYSLKGKMCTHPIYYAFKVFSHFGVSDFNTITLKNLESISPFPALFNQAINVLQTRVRNNNPHLESVYFKSTILQDQLGFVIDSTMSNQPVELLDETDSNLSEEELERVRRYNQSVKKDDHLI